MTCPPHAHLVLLSGERGKRNVRNAVGPVGTPVAAERAVAQARTAIQESAGPGTDGVGNTPAGWRAYRADCPGPASTDTTSPGSRRGGSADRLGPVRGPDLGAGGPALGIGWSRA